MIKVYGSIDGKSWTYIKKAKLPSRIIGVIRINTFPFNMIMIQNSFKKKSNKTGLGREE